MESKRAEPDCAQLSQDPVSNKSLIWLYDVRIEWAFALIIAVTVSLNLYLIYQYSINLPFADDFDQQFARLRNLEKGYWNLWQFLFKQHNEHRLTTTHLATLLSVVVLGEVDIKVQLMGTALLLIALLVCFSRLVAPPNRLAFSALMASYLLLPNASSIWLGGSLQYYTVVLFGVLTLMSLSQVHRPIYFLLSLSSFVLACFSMASGVVLIVPALLMLLLKSKAKPATKLAWGFGAMVCLAVFFWHYQPSSNASSLGYALINPIYTVQYGLLFLGNSFFGLIVGRPIQLLSAVLLLFLGLSLLRNSAYKKIFGYTSFYIWLYLICIIGLVVLGRVSNEEWQTALSVRYQLYTKTFWLAALILLVNLKCLSRQTLLIGVLLSCTYYLAGFNVSLNIMQNKQLDLSMAMSEMIFSANTSNLTYPNNQAMAANITKTAMGMRRYHPSFVASKSITVPKLGSEKVRSLPTLELRDLRFNQYRRLTFEGSFSSPPTILLSGFNDDATLAPRAYLARKVPRTNRYEVLINEHTTPTPDELSLHILVDGAVHAKLDLPRPWRLPGSMLRYAEPIY